MAKPEPVVLASLIRQLIEKWESGHVGQVGTRVTGAEALVAKICADDLSALLAAQQQARRNEWRMDADGALDDVVVDDVATFRLERMSDDHIWGCVYHPDGSRTTFNIHGDRVSLHAEHEPGSSALLAAPVQAHEETRMSERLNFHAIIGPNGMCMCGVNDDGSVVTCGDLLDQYVAARLAALPQGAEGSPTAEQKKS